MLNIATLVEKWAKQSPTQKLQTYLLVVAIIAVFGVVNIYNRREFERAEQVKLLNASLDKCEIKNENLEREYRDYLIKANTQKNELVQTIDSIKTEVKNEK